MSSTLDDQIEQLKNTIAGMESQRGALGDAVVEAALTPLQRRLDELTALLAAREAQPVTEPAQQRKLVTLLFMDIAGSTSIAEHMDPEDVSEVFDSTLKKLAQPVEEHGGRVTRFMGDGFLAVFGAPTAREDDPEQAVRTGLRILSLASEIAADLEEARDIQGFNVRVGVNTGLVMLGGETEAENTLMGAAVNLAARLESAAPPGGLLISHDTYRHVRGVFDVEAMEPVRVKGFDEAVKVYHVQRVRPRAFRLYTRGVEGIETRMVGRETELKYLQDALLTAIEEGEGQMVTIAGEAGVGKSRLLYEFQDWIELLPPPAVRFFEGRARQEAQGLPYGLLRDIFAFRFQIQDNDSTEIARQKIIIGFEDVLGSDQEGEMRAHLLGQWLGYDFSGSPHLKGVLTDAEQLRNRGLMYLGEYFRTLGGQAPIVVFLEDIHWADDSSLDALNWLEQRIQQQSLLIVCAARLSLFERRPYWGEGQAHHIRLYLRPLSKRESRQLVGELLKLADQVPDKLREMVVEGAEGNPFYVEELIKMLIEDSVIVKGAETWHVHTERLAEIDVPPTLAGVLQARLDSLPAKERTILQQASVIGRHFWDRIVAYIQSAEDEGEEIVPQALTALRGRELIYRREESAFAEASEYIFKHDILREVTYESVLKRLRRRYHGLVADWLIAQDIGIAAESNGMIAEHLLLAGRKEQASQYFIQAGERALTSYANGEAEAHFRKALEYAAGVNLRAACLAGLGETLGRQGLREEAILKMHEAIDLYHKIQEYDRVAHLYTRISYVLWNDDYHKAWEICQEGLERLADAKDSPGLAYLLAEAGRTAFFSRPNEEVIVLGNRALEMAERLEVVESWAEAQITLSMVAEDAQQAIRILQEALEVCEAHGLLRTAARVCLNLGYFYWISMGGAERAVKYAIKAAEVHRHIGEIDDMGMDLMNVTSFLVSFEHLNSVRDSIVEFLNKSSALESQVEICLQFTLALVSHHRGEWVQALERTKAQLHELRKRGNLQNITEWTRLLVDTILELHHFAGLDYLVQAEAALLENLGYKWVVNESYFTLAAVSARKNSIPEAHAYLVEAPEKRLNKWEESCRLRADIELALAEQRWDEALVACQCLNDIYQAGNYRWEWARTLIDLGDALMGRDLPGDREQAHDVFHQSLEMFTEMDAPGYVRVVEERLVKL